tara:strand:+ start:9249 stop:9497 length:249 start_codon:yes stop_codon:yes gene_type:complete
MLGAELVALIAVIGTTLSGILTTVFTSRCSEISCCCMHCVREVLPPPDSTGHQSIPPPDAHAHQLIPNRDDVVHNAIPIEQS